MRFFKQSLARFSAALLLTFGLTLPANAGDVTIQSVQSGKYTAFTSGYLTANTTQARAYVFQEVHMGGSSYAFRDRASGRYLRAGVTGNSLMALGGREIGTWEHFEVITRGGVSTLRSMQNGKYVRAGIGSNSLLGAVSNNRGGWEQFRITPVGAPPAAAWTPPFAGSWKVRRVLNAAGNRIPLNRVALQSADFNIYQDGRFTFTAGCNNVTGRFIHRPADSGISLTNVFITRVNCANAAFDLERTVMSVLSEIRFARMGSDRLFLTRNAQGSSALELFQP